VGRERFKYPTTIRVLLLGCSAGVRVFSTRPHGRPCARARPGLLSSTITTTTTTTKIRIESPDPSHSDPARLTQAQVTHLMRRLSGSQTGLQPGEADLSSLSASWYHLCVQPFSKNRKAAKIDKLTIGKRRQCHEISVKKRRRSRAGQRHPD